MMELYEAGYVDLGSATGKFTYSFGSMVGSLDHILASPPAADLVSGVDIWNVNAYESIAFEHSRHNYNVTTSTATTHTAQATTTPSVGLDLLDQPTMAPPGATGHWTVTAHGVTATLDIVLALVLAGGGSSSYGSGVKWPSGSLGSCLPCARARCR